MLNFNNKKDQNQLQFIQCSPSQYPTHDEGAQDTDITPTQCLLHLSELESHRNNGKMYSEEREFGEAEVTPWMNTPFRVKSKGKNKSKNTTILTCVDDKNRSITNARPQDRKDRNHDSRVYLTKKDSSRQIKVGKSKQSSKNIHSAIARYNDQADNLTVNSHDFSHSHKKIDGYKNMALLRTGNFHGKLSSSCQKGKGKSKRLYGNQNQFSEVGCFGLEQGLEECKKNLTVRQKNSVTDAILRQNTGIVNKARVNCMDSIENYEDFKPQSQEKQYQQPVQLDHQIFQTQKHPDPPQKQAQPIFRKAEFQNILTDAQKKASEYHRIKHKILQSIKKQSQIRESQQFDINRSKKMLGRYFKQIQEKKPKNKIRYAFQNCNMSVVYSSTSGAGDRGSSSGLNAGNVMNGSLGNGPVNVKTQIVDLGFESSNPLTKHLYDKYRLLLSKGK